MKITNPIIRGFYPDPSICYANHKYYLVCSSMQYFPGVPLFESEDLVNFTQIGHCLTRPSQVALQGIASSGGVFAPTIRYHQGTFYMVTTNDTYHKNFYVCTNDIYGSWSDPIYVEQGGIDPSLYFEGDKTYFMSNGSDENGNGCIYQCEINPLTGDKLTESVPIWKGTGGKYLESPHLYLYHDTYYLMAAEGGTEYGHMITYAKGPTPYGPFISYPQNPVLTNRNLSGPASLIHGIGHGDLIDDAFGNTYLVCLGFRQADTWVPYHHLGREVFLVPVQWQEDGWFTAGVSGCVKEIMDFPDVLPQQKAVSYDTTLLSLSKNSLCICHLREHLAQNYQITKDRITLHGTSITLEKADSPTFLGIRQSEFHTYLCAKITCSNGEGGITFYMDEHHHYDCGISKSEEETTAFLRIHIGDAISTISKVVLLSSENSVVMQIVSDPMHYYFFLQQDTLTTFLGKVQAKYLSSEVAGGFTGVVMGMYAIANQEGRNTVTIDDFTWKQGVSPFPPINHEIFQQH